MIPRLCNIPKKESFFLFGPRQTGKSTLIKMDFSSETTLSYNLLLNNEFVRLKANPDLFIKEVVTRPPHITHIFVDEAQRVSELLNGVHYILEETTNPPQFILSGSSARKLKKEHANLLGGRAWTRHLHPLTQRELGNQFDLTRALSRGTLPAIYLSESEESVFEILNSYVSTYIEEEIRQEGAVRNIGTFSRFLLRAIGLSGEVINYSSIARQTMTSDKTIKEYFQILEDTLLGFHLLPYASSLRKKLSTHPKFYSFDGGVQRAISGQIKSLLQPGSSEFGNSFELWVIGEIRRVLSYCQVKAELSHYSVHQGAEVDLIIEFSKKEVWAIEIKSSLNVGLKDVRAGLDSFIEISPKARCICIHSGEKSRVESGIEFIPWNVFFDELWKHFS